MQGFNGKKHYFQNKLSEFTKKIVNISQVSCKKAENGV